MAATFISGLEPAIADKIRDSGATRLYPARSYIFYEGDPGNSVLVVEAGLLRIDRTTRSGRIALLDLAMQGDLIGELSIIDEAPRSATLSTITASTVRYVPAAVFQQLISSDRLLVDAVMRRLAQRIRALSTQFLETSTMDAPSRIASRLLRLVDIEQTLGRAALHADGSVELKMPITQEELGQWAGLGREGAVKGLKTLRAVNLIETGRKRVLIKDVKRMVDFVAD